MDLEEKIASLGSRLFETAKKEQPGLFNADYWQGRLMDWVMKDPSFKVDMFRFVDVLPQLNSSEAISEHVRQYLLKEERPLPTLISAALKAATNRLTAKIATKTIRDNVLDMAERFILGRTAQEAVGALKKLHRDGIAFTVDLLGEATLSEKEALIYQQRYLNLIEELSKAASEWPEEISIDRNHLGPIPRTNVSMKISSMFSQLRPSDPKGSVTQLKARLLPILRRAKELNVFVNFDLEQWDYHEITYDLFEEIALTEDFRSWPHLGIVIQAYLKNAINDAERLRALSKKRGCPITVRLVKGAYWDYEIVRAAHKGIEPPVIVGKSACDANYEKISAFLLDNVDHIHSAFGSHNLRSLAHAIAYAEKKGLPRNAYEIQMLYGMAEPERKALKSLGHRVRLYAPVGELLVGMAYLVRRLLENTSNAGFLQLTHHAKVNVEVLMKKPIPDAAQEKKTDNSETKFQNASFSDFLDPRVREAFEKAIAMQRGKMPSLIPSVVDGVAKKTSQDLHAHFCASDEQLKVYDIACATTEDCDRAVDAAATAFGGWRSRTVVERGQLLLRLADILERDRISLAALQTLEVGKPWLEADADVAEAIDFCRFYAKRSQVELGEQNQVAMLGEENKMHFIGRGPTAIIAPWNFPLAILCGMSTAALVAGNSILIKPAEQSSMTAFALFERMMEAGFPKGVVHFLPGRGEIIGAHLVSHPKVAQIAFTGSRAVGLSIYQNAAKTLETQSQLKRVVCEMGGKNAIIVDDDADLDEAVSAVVTSAFGYAGQKCSACSRVIVLEAVADSFIERLVEATRSLPLEKAYSPSCVLGPVIDAEAHARLLKELDSNSDAQLHYRGEERTDGFFVPPAIFEVTDSGHRLMQVEFFGPLVTIMRTPSFAQAIEIANSTPYALTGAVFSRSPLNLKAARENFRVGNLYLNRGSTGAMVGRQPFGGFKMSGLGSKAGGPGYLLHFADPVCVTENTMRRGFTPDLES